MKTLLLIFSIILLANCATVPSPYRFEILSPDTTHVKFHFLRTQINDGNPVLKGSLSYKPYSPARKSGHIDIVVYSPSGQLLSEFTAPYQTPLNAKHAWSKTGVDFTASLPVAPPAGSVIKLAFHVDQQRQKVDAAHTNIAR